MQALSRLCASKTFSNVASSPVKRIYSSSTQNDIDIFFGSLVDAEKNSLKQRTRCSPSATTDDMASTVRHLNYLPNVKTVGDMATVKRILGRCKEVTHWTKKNDPEQWKVTREDPEAPMRWCQDPCSSFTMFYIRQYSRKSPQCIWDGRTSFVLQARLSYWPAKDSHCFQHDSQKDHSSPEQESRGQNCFSTEKSVVSIGKSPPQRLVRQSCRHIRLSSVKGKFESVPIGPSTTTSWSRHHQSSSRQLESIRHQGSWSSSFESQLTEPLIFNLIPKLIHCTLDKRGCSRRSNLFFEMRCEPNKDGMVDGKIGFQKSLMNRVDIEGEDDVTTSVSHGRSKGVLNMSFGSIHPILLHHGWHMGWLPSIHQSMGLQPHTQSSSSTDQPDHWRLQCTHGDQVQWPSCTHCTTSWTTIWDADANWASPRHKVRQPAVSSWKLKTAKCHLSTNIPFSQGVPPPDLLLYHFSTWFQLETYKIRDMTRGCFSMDELHPIKITWHPSMLTPVCHVNLKLEVGILRVV